MCVVPRHSEESVAVGIQFIHSEASHFTGMLDNRKVCKCCSVFGKSLESLQTFEKVTAMSLKGFLS